MMRVHLRGVVIGVSTILSIAIIVSIFNALEVPDDPDTPRTRHALSADVDSDTDSAETPTRRQRAGGPGARAGGPGARAGGPGARAGGPGARAGGPGARAGGGGPGARAGGAGARAGGAGARAGGSGARAGGPAARAGGRFAADPDAPAPGARAGGPGSRRRASAGLEEDEESADLGSEEVAPPARARAGAAAGKASGRLSGAASRARAKSASAAEEDEAEEAPEPKASKRRKKAKTSEEKKEEEKEEEKPTEPPKKKEPPYPEWWKASYPRSGVSSVQEQFVGDQPLYPECPNFEMGSAASSKRYGYVEPPNYMRNSKNPCWFEWNGKKDILKCLPYFYVAGVAKGATGDLFRRLSAHPKVLVGGSSTYFWWDRLRYGASKNLKYTHEAKRANDPVSLREYAREVVGKHGKNLSKELLYRGKSDSIFGDASSTYLSENTQWNVFDGNQGCSEPRVIPATFIRHIFPEARIIIMLRDPVDRLYSRFLADVPFVQEFQNATASLFHTFTVQAVQTYRECFAKTSVRHCAYNASLFSNAVIRLSEGMYPIFLEDWFRVFPREQILILKFEEYTQNVRGHLIRAIDHLGLDHLDEYNLLKLTDLPVTRKGRTREEEGDMMPETVALLSEFYSPFMLKLADLLGDDKWLFTRQQVPLVRKNLEAHEEGTEDVMPNTGQQQPPQQEEQEEEEAKPQPEAGDPGGEEEERAEPSGV